MERTQILEEIGKMTVLELSQLIKDMEEKFGVSAAAAVAVAGPAAEGTTVASYFNPDEPGPEVVRFNAAFTARHGAPPDAGSALGYDCVRLLAHAMKQAVRDPRRSARARPRGS